MKSYSSEKQEKFVTSGKELRINFNHSTVDKEDFDGNVETQHVCDQVVVQRTAGRDEIIEAIIATRYPTYGSEIAAIQNGGDDAETHQTFRDKAKALADEWLSL